MKVKSFGGLALSQYEIDDDIPLEFGSNLAQLPGLAGAFDSDGDEQFRAPLVISRSFEFVESSYGAVDTALDALRAKANLGRKQLVIEMRDGSERITWAKLKRIRAPYKPDFLEHLPVQIAFEVAWPWLEDPNDVWYLDTGELLDDGLTLDRQYSTRSGAGSLTVTNNGGDRITRGQIVIRGSSTNPTVTNQTTGEAVAYSGTIAAGDYLVIDFGALSVKLSGVNGWDDLTIADDQTRLFSLAVGANTIDFTGGGTLEIHWAEVW